MNDLSADIDQIISRIKSAELEPEEESGITTKEIQEKLEKAGFPLRHRLKLKDMVGPGLDKARQLWDTVEAVDAILLLCGDRGPGKTQIATWLAARRVKSGKAAGLYVKCTDLFGEIKSTWHDGGRSVGTENDILRKYRRASYLVIDEMHERGASDWESRILVTLLDHRYDSMLTTVLISNYAKEKLAEAINPSILSRAAETGGIVDCNWPSYRTNQA
jgi:DNA replication protein DnaC